ncbi:hypothetical protein ABFS83_05G083800 [Erythranthe nasuta]
MANVPYANAVGSLMYCMVCSRPDLAYAASVISRFMADLGQAHWEALKWTLRYMKGSAEIGLLFKRNDRITCDAWKGFVDSDYAGSIDTRKSLTGYVFTLFGTAVSWKSNLQSVVALSTTKAEYMAVTEAVKEAIWMIGILQELGIEQKNVYVYCDNQSAIHLKKHQVFHERSKHIDVRLNFVRNIVFKGRVKVEKVHTDDNAADMLTKSLPVSKVKYCMDLVSCCRQC